MAEKFNLKNYYSNLTKVFKGNTPIVRARIANKIASQGQVGTPVGTARAFMKNVNTLYSNMMANYGQYGRLARYRRLYGNGQQ